MAPESAEDGGLDLGFGDDVVILDTQQRMKAQSNLGGELVPVETDGHPHGGVLVPSERVEFIEDVWGTPVSDHLYEGYLVYKDSIDNDDIHGIMAWSGSHDDSCRIRRDAVVDAIVDPKIDNTVTDIAEAVGADVARIRYDFKRLAELLDDVDYSDGQLKVPDPDTLWEIHCTVKDSNDGTLETIKE